MDGGRFKQDMKNTELKSYKRQEIVESHHCLRLEETRRKKEEWITTSCIYIVNLVLNPASQSF